MKSTLYIDGILYSGEWNLEVPLAGPCILKTPETESKVIVIEEVDGDVKTIKCITPRKVYDALRPLLDMTEDEWTIEMSGGSK